MKYFFSYLCKHPKTTQINLKPNPTHPNQKMSTLFDIIPTEISNKIYEIEKTMWQKEHKSRFIKTLDDISIINGNISNLNGNIYYQRILNIFMDNDSMIGIEDFNNLLNNNPVNISDNESYLDEYHKHFTNIMQAAYDTDRLHIDTYRSGPDYCYDVVVEFTEDLEYPDNSTSLISVVSNRDENPYNIQRFTSRRTKTDERIAVIPMNSNAVYNDLDIIWNIYIVVKGEYDKNIPRIEYL